MLTHKCAEWIIGPELAATILDGGLQARDIRNDVCTFAGGRCNDAMGRPDESKYMEPEYYLERRRATVANAQRLR